MLLWLRDIWNKKLEIDGIAFYPYADGIASSDNTNFLLHHAS